VPAALRANELASEMVKPLPPPEEMKAMMGRLHLPPAFPNEEYEFNNDEFNKAGD
jgi:hypothetical protein